VTGNSIADLIACRQNEDRGIDVETAKFGAELDTRHAGQADVDDHHVWSSTGSEPSPTPASGTEDVEPCTPVPDRQPSERRRRPRQHGRPSDGFIDIRTSSQGDH
jgi:hypothetical protein